jgi:hypothetical protein
MMKGMKEGMRCIGRKFESCFRINFLEERIELMQGPMEQGVVQDWGDNILS